jgi:membrane-associated protein
MIAELLDGIADLPTPLLVAVAGALTLAETTLGLGFLVPGEAGLLIAATGVRDTSAFVLMGAVVAGCAAAGDSIGYLLGRRFGSRLRESRLVGRIGPGHWDRAAELLRRHGAWAVFVARFLPVVRTLTPAAAGAARLPYGRFLPASLLGAASWSVLHVAIGAGAGEGARRIEDVLGAATWAVLAMLAVTTIGVRAVRRRRGNGSRPAASLPSGGRAR